MLQGWGVVVLEEINGDAMGKTVDPKKKDAEKLARLRSWGVKAAVVVLMLSGWLIFFSQKAPQVPQAGQPAQGQAGQPKPPEPSGNYVLSYSMVVMCIGLGLLLVTRASHRRDRARPEQYQEKMDTVEEPPEAEAKKK
jgi:hypothetical protein